MIDSFDLTRHAVFEASAGTGKTHVIMQLTLRLLREEHCNLDDILIVTFTEKATGELKDRLRRALETAIDREPDKAAILQRQLDRIDRAAISTIHGFCKRLLQEHAADLGQDFNADLVMDKPLRLEALREAQRKDWHARFGARLPEVLKAAGYCRGAVTKWDGNLRTIIDKYRPECGHRLVPDAPPALDDETSMRDALAVFTIEQARHRLRDVKRQRGIMTFDDLIERVAAGLDPAINPRANVVIDALQRQFRFAIVDEFQDTDLLQWTIFQRLFLTGSAARLLGAAGLLDAAETPTRLVVVGDPKQAIYGFRGADLPTYLRAVSEMRGQWDAADHRLGVNWRSCPELIDGLNRFFADGEFFPSERQLAYVPVAAPPAELRRAELLADSSNRRAITIVDVTGGEKTAASKARISYAHFIAREIDRLLHGADGDSVLEFRDKSDIRRLSARHVCILVFRHSEANPIKAALAKRRIPYSHYKSAGVRSAPEARDLRLVLTALAHPDQNRHFTRALMTMFFRISPCDLMASDALAAEHPARVLFDRWRTFADRRQWSDLFASLLDETGVLFHDRENPDYDRRVANLKHLMGGLQEAGYRSNLDLFELLELFDGDDSDEDERDDYQPRETDEPRVQIMTIFAAKGLEFPVVFLAGGFTNDDRKNIAYRDDAGRLTFDLSYVFAKRRTGEIVERIDADRADEVRRLLYVALTRAQFKLYVPIMAAKKMADKSAIVALIAPAVERSGLTDSAIAAVIEPSENLAAPTATSVVKVARPKPLIVDPLLLEFDASIGRRRTRVQSFTGLHLLLKKEQAEAFGDKPDRRDELDESIVGPSDPFRGPVFGEMVHEIFERIDFAEVRRAVRDSDLDAGPARRLIDEYVSRFLPRLTTRAPDAALAEACRRALCGMLWNALRTPLSPLGGRLCDLARSDCLQEIEFLYPDGARLADGSTFIKGFIDLVFRWKNRIYLLDWKTNVLPAYDRESLEAGMSDAGYHLQYELYWEALKRWLTRTSGSVKYRMGGVLYLFLRGLNGIDDAQGVYYVPADDVKPRTPRDG